MVEAYRAAEAGDELGELVRTYRGRTFGQFVVEQNRSLGAMVVLTVPMVALTWSDEVYGPIARVILGVLTAWLLYRLVRWALRLETIEIRERGLRRIGRRAPRTLAFEDVASLHASFVETRTRAGVDDDSSVTIRPKNGPDLRFDASIGELRDLAQDLSRGTLPHIAPRVLAALRAGEQVAFGCVRADARGVGRSAQKIAWRELRRPEIIRGELVLTGPRDQSDEAPLGAVANWHVLLWLAAALHDADLAQVEPPSHAVLARAPHR